MFNINIVIYFLPYPHAKIRTTRDRTKMAKILGGE